MGAQDRHVELRVGHHAGEGHVVALVGVGLVVDHAQRVGDLLAAVRHALDRVLVVGDGGPLGHVLVGDQQGLARLLAVGEAGAVHHRALAGLAHVAVGAVGEALVGGGVAHAVRVALALELAHARAGPRRGRRRTRPTQMAPRQSGGTSAVRTAQRSATNRAQREDEGSRTSPYLYMWSRGRAIAQGGFRRLTRCNVFSPDDDAHTVSWRVLRSCCCRRRTRPRRAELLRFAHGRARRHRLGARMSRTSPRTSSGGTRGEVKVKLSSPA